MTDKVVPLQLRTSGEAKPVKEEDAATNPEARAEVKNVINTFAVETAKGLPQSIIVIMRTAEGKDAIYSGGAFDVLITVGLLEELKHVMLNARWDAME